ncbi:diguanylate cyclase [Massilia sp. LXY-6]|uniref:diguanylate cyclase n=1 Tax=Massilia sp. LXY-6 TaxID=3379823 RepID=UPI003EE1097F
MSADSHYDFAAALLVQLVVPAFVLDAHGRVAIWNHACERLTGISAAEMVGTSKHSLGFYHEARPTLADLILTDRIEDAKLLYRVYNTTAGIADQEGKPRGTVSGAGWCDMPRTGERRFLVMDAGPVYDGSGKLFGVLETWRDMTVQKEAQLALERLVMRDGLTGIANRRCFDETLHKEWEQARREAGVLSLLLIDVDLFKRYNDTYGHQAGDECLQRVAAILSGQVRVYDLAARYGGEEFVVLLPQQSLAGAAAVAERIRAAVELSAPGDPAPAGGRTTVSIGVATLEGNDPASPEQLLARADAALYRAKEEGRNRVVLHD